MPTRRDPIQTVEISDFTPGIYSAGGSPTRLIPAPLGAAQLTNTYRCVGLKNGGLGPLPAISRMYDAPSNPDAGVAPVNGFVSVGFMALGTIFSSTSAGNELDELHLDIQYTVAGSPNTSKFRWYRIRTIDSPVTSELIGTETTPQTGFCAPSMVATRMIVVGSTVPQNNQILLVHSWRANDLAVNRFWIYPDPSTPMLNTPIVNPSAEASGMLIAHQSRILVLQSTFEQHGVNAFSISNELINYTDPPLTTVPQATRTQLAGEHPYGYGSFGSISSGELILIKRFGGAIVVSGDIFAPSVTSLPGVTSTGLANNEGTFSPIGLVYVGNYGRGVYAWNGSSSSEDLSPNIDLSTDPLYRSDVVEGFSSGGPQYWHESWGPYVVFSNNYILDTRSRAWWILEDPTVYNIGMMTSSKARDRMFFVESKWGLGATQQIARGKLSVPVSSYSWNSQPIPVSIGRDIETRRVDVLASAASGTTSTVTVTLTAMDGSTQSHTFHITPAGQPVRLTYPYAIVGTNITARIQADSGNAAIPAPIVYSVTMHYYEDTTIPDAA